MHKSASTILMISTTCAFLAAAPVSADTFKIEIDYMVGNGHTHKPSQQVIDAVVQMFACQGHTLIVDVDDAIPHYNVLIRNPNNCNSSLFDYGGSANSYGALKSLYFDHSEAAGWHYCIFAHNYEDQSCNVTSSSGLGELSGWHFIVTLGSFSDQVGTPFDQASTLAHEFGHNLGLSHCGNMECGNINSSAYVGPFTPNLTSTMSYRYQLAGVHNNLVFNHLAPPEALFKEIDYSHGRMCSLNENNLDETIGTVMTTTDWNCNGTLQTGVVKDIRGDNSGWCSANSSKHVLSDFNEWAAIGDPSVLASTPQEISCITAEEWQEVLNTNLAGGFSQPTLTTEACINGLNVFIGPSSIPIGTCPFPMSSVQLAHDAAPSGSVFFIKPGTYNESGVVTLNKPGTYLCNIGTAVVK